MSFSITAIGTAVATGTDSQTYQRVFTPADSCVIYMHAMGRGAAAPSSPTISDDIGLTWSSLFNQTVGNSRHRIWRTIISGTSPGPVTVTIDWGATILGCSMGMTQVTGGDLTTPNVALSGKSTTGTSTTPSPGTVNALAQSTNAQLLWVAHQGAAADAEPELGWTELYDVANGSPSQGACAYYRIASEDTTPSVTLSSSVAWMAAANELALASSAATVTDSDSGTLGESSALAPVVTATEAVTLSEASLVENTVGVDLGTLGESSSSLLVTETGPDGTLSEAYTLGAALSVSDSAALSESGAVVAGTVFQTGSEAVTLGEATTLSSTFPGIVVDQVVSESAALSEAAYVGYSVGPGTDTGTLSEASAKAVGQNISPSDSDPGVFGETVEPSAVLVAVDTGTLAESGSVIVELVGSESATVDEILAALLADPVASDSGTMTDASILDGGFTGSVRGQAVLAGRLVGATAMDPLLSGTIALRT